LIGDEQTFFDGLTAANIKFRTDCGGKGTCGKCKVFIQGRCTELTSQERVLLPPPELGAGYRLACQVRPLSDCVVTLAPETRLSKRKIVIGGISTALDVSPSVSKVYVELTPPSIDDPEPDWERLKEGIKRQRRVERLDISPRALSKLPETLRAGDWKVTTAILHNDLVVATEPGNTTHRILGAAVDIGTSKIISYLVDLTNGEILRTSTLENPMMPWGEDIMSRITFCLESREKFDHLHNILTEGVSNCLHAVCQESGFPVSDIYEIVVVGNTAMHHFLLGIHPKHLALAPYVPAIRDHVDLNPAEVGLKINEHAGLHVPPVIAGFVGADATADLVAMGIDSSEEMTLGLDIGTNTEIFLGNREEITTCSCASGPAFEGYHIRHGMKAVSGAIERFWYDEAEHSWRFATIECEAPRGICGSGMIDIVAELFRRGLIDSSGRFRSGDREFLVSGSSSGEITLDQHDIREIQLAKAAIHAGCAILMKKKNLTENDIDKVLIAGAFGNYIDPENAKIIGLIPDLPSQKIRFLGNAAGTGAVMILLSSEARERATRIAEGTRYVELAAEREFQTEYLDSLHLPHRDRGRYPNVWNLVERSMKVGCG
jgi:uncharacterized 2Fe-2S/4Fe-4S cluster protein (DUF4445 family)